MKVRLENLTKIFPSRGKDGVETTAVSNFTYEIPDGKLIGLAACSADCETMWQIGVDVLPEYRRKGIASALTSQLAVEIVKRDKVPFYCCAWSNIKSARNAIKSGFLPAWVEMTVKPASFVEEMNR